MSLTLLTPSLSHRATMLGEMLRSVSAQTVQPDSHLIRIHTPERPSVQGLVDQRNALLKMVQTEWMAWVDDDDLLLPNHVETLLSGMDGADLVYTWPKGPQPFEKWDVTGWSQEELLMALLAGNGIPSCVAMRTSMVYATGGWVKPMAGPIRFDDHDMLFRLASMGARFRCIPEETWVYRRGGWPRLTA